MKLTVFAILLVLMIGFILMQMEANTNTQLQTLNAVELEVTRGAGNCQKYSGSKDSYGKPCGSLACQNNNFWYSTKREAKEYQKCGTKSDNTDCHYDPGQRQTCAKKLVYVGPNCSGLIFPPGTVNIEQNSPYTVPGCYTSG